MTRKHFVAIAETIRKADVSDEARAVFAADMARVLRSENPRFDRDRFIHAATGV